MAAAGMLSATGGRVLNVTNESGHYMPEPGLNEQLLTQLEQLGVSTKDITVTDIRE